MSLVYKCKMCGAALTIEKGNFLATCEYCGSQQTVPAADDDKKLTLFVRANRLRNLCEFDKASGVYEAIVSDFPEEAEAYWGLVLCKYGIEYVDDPKTAGRIPTCHRSSFDSVMDDSNYDMTLEYAEGDAKKLYREEAKQIEELRRGIIEISNKEAPYDIFICYKEKDDAGERTIDSVIAQDVYDALTAKGFRVFFSRITLEDKLGVEYEPYIFAALNSAKVMLAFGTDYDYFNAVWVKNEWSRFLELIAKGEKKTLIPCFKDIDAYDMPKEFAKLQAQDLGKIGAIQDLVRGVEKLISPKLEQSSADFASDNAAALLIQRAYMLLEKGEFKNADMLCEQALAHDPNSAEAYLGKLLAELLIGRKEDLAKAKNNINKYDNYKHALENADEALASELEEYAKQSVINQKKRRKTITTRIIVSSLFVFTMVVGVYHYITNWGEQTKAYIEGHIALKNEDHITAYNKFYQANGFLDAWDRSECLYDVVQSELTEEYRRKYMSIFGDYNFEPGDIIKFGSFEQDNVYNDGLEPIEWIVVRKTDNSVLLISKYILDWVNKNDIYTWINHTFMNNAFSESEKECIVNVTYIGSYEAKTSLGINNLSATPTKYSIAGTDIDLEYSSRWWCSDGIVYSDGRFAQTKYVSVTAGGVRPAIWIKLPEKAVAESMGE